jgi:hypothetical protein
MVSQLSQGWETLVLECDGVGAGKKPERVASAGYDRSCVVKTQQPPQARISFPPVGQTKLRRAKQGESASQVSDERLRVAHPLSALGRARSHPHPSRGQIQAPPTQRNLSALQLRPSTCGAETPFLPPPPPLFLVFCAVGVFFGLTLCSCCTVSLSCQLRFEASFALLYEWRRAGLLGHGGRTPTRHPRLHSPLHRVVVQTKPTNPASEMQPRPNARWAQSHSAPPSVACVSAQRYASPI